MKNTRQAQQVIEYLLVFAGIVVTILGVSSVVGNKTSGILGDTFDDFSDDEIYTYAWTLSDCSPCSVTACGQEGVHTCQYICERNDGAPVNDEECSDQGEKPDPQEKPCFTDPCPVDCEWNDWPDCVTNPSADGCGPCEPACGSDRERFVQRTVRVEGAHGGELCNPDDGVQTVPCSAVECEGICGDGVINLQSDGNPEICDGNDLGEYEGLDCAALSSEDSAGHVFNNGSFVCGKDCTLDLSNCEYEECGDVTNYGYPPDTCGGRCTLGLPGTECIGCPEGETCTEGEGVCPDYYETQEQECWQQKYTGDPVEGTEYYQYLCAYQPGCEFSCGEMSPYAQWCHDSYRSGLEEDSLTVHYDKDSCPLSSEDHLCAAECRVFPLTKGDGTECVCPPYIDDGGAESPTALTLTDGGEGNDDCCCPSSVDPGAVTGWSDRHIYTCTAEALCGNERIDGDEDCDGGVDLTCSEYNLYLYYEATGEDKTTNPDPDINEWTGDVACNNCQWDSASCVIYPNCTDEIQGCGSGISFPDYLGNTTTCTENQRFVWTTCTSTGGDIYTYGRCDEDSFCDCTDECSANYCDADTPHLCADTDPSDRCLEETVSASCNPPETLCSVASGSCIDNCTHENGCTDVGGFCNGQMPYTCSVGTDGCFDRIDSAACADTCFNGNCCENDAECIGKVGNICDATTEPYEKGYITCEYIDGCYKKTNDAECTKANDVCRPDKGGQCKNANAG